MSYNLLHQYAQLATGKRALELSNSETNYQWLTAQGFRVDREIGTQSNYYDLVVSTYALDRSLFPKIEEMLKEGGTLLVEAYLHHPDNQVKTEVPLLEEGELEATFDDRYNLLHIKEWWDSDNQMMIGSMVAQKRAGGMSLDDFWA